MSYFWCLEKVDKIPHKIVKKRSRIRLCFLKKSVKKSDHHFFNNDSISVFRALSIHVSKVEIRVVAEEISTKSWFFQDSVDDNSSRRPQNKKIPTGLFFFGSLFHVQQFIAILEEQNFSRCFTYIYSGVVL